MRAKHEWRTCGCGAQIGLRESCARCASAERARLHASGIGHKECWREFRGDGSSMSECDREEAAARKAARARWDAIRLPERREYFCVPPMTTPQDIGEMAADEAIEEARKMGLSGHEADVYINRKAREAYNKAVQDEARTQWELAGMCGTTGMCGTNSVVRGGVISGLTTALLDDNGRVRGYDQAAQYVGAELKWPEVGEEASWAVAECHMRRDNGARYVIVGNTEVYAMRDGALSFLGSDCLWHKSQSAPSRVRWVRIA